MAIIIGIVVFLFIGTLVMALMPSGSKTDIQEKLRAMARNPETIDLTELELSKPFAERVMKPIVEKIGNLVRKVTPVEVINSAQRKINAGGMKMNPALLVGFQLVLAVLLPGLLIGVGIIAKMGAMKGLAIIAFAAAIGYKMPDVWLTSKVNARKLAIQRALPDALDLLMISVEAGLGFDMALNKVVEKMKGPLCQEFARAIYEIRLGKPRRESLKNMAERVDVPDLSQFISALVQADKLGVSIGNVLRVQSDQMRMKRRQRAEETAMKAPLKMSFVLVFFVLPALLIVLLGPAAISVMNELGGSRK